jgi:hypothetical protein
MTVNETTTSNAASTRKAALQSVRTAVMGESANAWGILIVDVTSGALRVVANASGKGKLPADRVAELVSSNKAKRVLVVLPVQDTTARTLSLPPDAQLDEDSVRLFGEAHAPAGAPAHRVGAGVLRSAGAPPVLFVTSWPDIAPASEGSAALPAWSSKLASAKIRENFVTPAAGIAAIMQAGVASAVCYSDADCIIAAARGERGATVRQVVEDSDDGSWDATVHDVLSQLATSVGHAGEVVAPQGSRACMTSITSTASSLDFALQRALPGMPREPIWQAELLPLIGSAILLNTSKADVATGQSAASLAPCATLSRKEPVPEVPAVVKVSAWAGRKRVWPLLAGVAVLALVAGPIGFTSVRANVAKNKAKELDAAREKTKDIELKAAVYTQLDTTRWPLSKMLADISGAAPVGVSIKSLRMTVGQPLSIQGEASDAAQVTDFQAALSATGQYRNIKQNRVSKKSAGEGVEFDIAAEAANVHVPVTPAQDFASTPLAVRLYGEGATNTTMPVGAVKQVRRSGTRANASSSSGSSSSTDKPAETTRRPAEAPSSEPPPALTDEDIAKLTSGEAMRGWTSRRSYLSKNAGIDSGLKARLEEEIRKLQEHQKKAPAAASTEKKEGGS